MCESVGRYQWLLLLLPPLPLPLLLLRRFCRRRRHWLRCSI